MRAFEVDVMVSVMASHLVTRTRPTSGWRWRRRDRWDTCSCVGAIGRRIGRGSSVGTEAPEAAACSRSCRSTPRTSSVSWRPSTCTRHHPCNGTSATCR